MAALFLLSVCLFLVWDGMVDVLLLLPVLPVLCM